MVKINSQLKKIGISAKESAAEFLRFESTSRNNALLKIADEILVRKNEIIAANNCDVNNAISSGLSPSLIGRMKLDESSIKKISNLCNGRVNGNFQRKTGKSTEFSAF